MHFSASRSSLPRACTGISKVAIPDLLCRTGDQVQKMSAAVYDGQQSIAQLVAHTQSVLLRGGGCMARLCCSKITMTVWRTFGCPALRSLLCGASRCIVQFSSAKPSLGSAAPTRASAEREHCTVSLHLDSSSAFCIFIDPGYSAKSRRDTDLACSRADPLGQPSGVHRCLVAFHVIHLTVRRSWRAYTVRNEKLCMSIDTLGVDVQLLMHHGQLSKARLRLACHCQPQTMPCRSLTPRPFTTRNLPEFRLGPCALA